MAKEYRWSVTIDGEEHSVHCTVNNNRYDIWVDEEDLTTVYRKNFQDVSDRLEEPLLIGGKMCRFVVLNAVPDIEVDGVLVGSRKDYQQEKEKQDKATKIMAWVQIAISAAAILAYAVMAVGGVDMSRWHFTLGFGIFILVTGVMQLRNVRK